MVAYAQPKSSEDHEVRSQSLSIWWLCRYSIQHTAEFACIHVVDRIATSASPIISIADAAAILKKVEDVGWGPELYVVHAVTRGMVPLSP
jgi:hypothetical protein